MFLYDRLYDYISIIHFIFYIAYRANSAKTLINYLYNDSNLYLKRKFKLYQKSLKIKIKKYKKHYAISYR